MCGFILMTPSSKVNDVVRGLPAKKIFSCANKEKTAWTFVNL